MQVAQTILAQLGRARMRITYAIKETGAKRSLSHADKVANVAAYRADLDVLEKFATALGEAHNLGGY